MLTEKFRAVGWRLSIGVTTTAAAVVAVTAGAGRVQAQAQAQAQDDTSGSSLVPNPAPDAGLPGGSLIEDILGRLKYGALAAAVAGLLIGGIAIGVGYSGSHYGASAAGRRWLLGGIGAAIVAGLAHTVVAGVGRQEGPHGHMHRHDRVDQIVDRDPGLGLEQPVPDGVLERPHPSPARRRAAPGARPSAPMVASHQR